MKDLARALTAIGAGVVLGAFVAAQFNFFWWLGMIAGGLVAYLVFDWAGVIRAVGHIWKYTAGITKADWKALGWLAAAALSISATTTAATFLLSLPAVRVEFSRLPGVLDWLSIFSVGVIFYMCLMGLLARDAGGLQGKQEEYVWVCKQLNPFQLFVCWPIRGFVGLLSRIPRALAAVLEFIKAVGRFVGRVFMMIHSEARLFCLVDAALGVAVFHYAGNSLLAGLAAGELAGVLGHLWVRRRQAAEIKGGAPA